MYGTYDNVMGNLDSPWLSMDIKIWGDLIKDVPRTRIRKGADIIWSEKEHSNIYIVAWGRFCIRLLHESGLQKHLYIACPGAMIGEIDCILGYSHTLTATAIVESEVYCVSHKKLLTQFQTNQTLANHLLRYGARKNRMLINQIAMLSFENASQRIANLLIYLCDNNGVETPEGIWLNLPFTCAEMAAIANTSRVTANNTLLALIEEGILEKRNGRYLVKDIERLHQMIKG